MEPNKNDDPFSIKYRKYTPSWNLQDEEINNLSSKQLFLISSTASVISRTIVSPLELVQTNVQLGFVDRRLSFFSKFRNIFHFGKPINFWRGNLIGCLRIFPYNFISIQAYKYFHSSPEIVNPSSQDIRTAILVGFISSFLTYPLDTLKVKLMADAHPMERKFNGLFHCLVTTIKQEGIIGLFRGVVPMALSFIPLTYCTFWFYNKLGSLRNRLKAEYEIDFDTPIPLLCLITMVSTTLAYPFDTMKKRLQFFRGDSEKRTIGHELVTGNILDSRFRLLMAGNSINLFRTVPYTLIFALSLDILKELELRRNGIYDIPLRDSFRKRKKTTEEKSLPNLNFIPNQTNTSLRTRTFSDEKE